MPADIVHFTGKLTKVKAEDACRIAAYLVRGNEILASEPVSSEGAVHLAVARGKATEASPYGLEVVIGPAGMRNQIRAVPGLQRAAIANQKVIATGDRIEIPMRSILLTPEILVPWWQWCEWYCVSGQVVGSDGCPVPFAQVTVSSVDFLLLKSPLVSVPADANGNFTACFNWCEDGCWPCWPFWWACWPWWWELDILHVLEHIDQARPGPLVGPGPVELRRPQLAINKPDVRTMVRGEGFASARALAAPIQADEARTSLIRRKLSNPAIQRLFPWWWWCSEDPNLCFTVTQAGTVVLDENPATDTHWSVEEGDTFTLVATGPAVTSCSGDHKPLHGFLWNRVGNTGVDAIHQGYADGTAGTEFSDMAFWSTLDIYGEFAPGSNVAYYQVDADRWTGDPARGGTANGAPAPLGSPLTNRVLIWHAISGAVTIHDVPMGPFDHAGVTNLYSTQEQRPSVPTTLLPPFPTHAPGDFILWSFDGRKVCADASVLAGASSGGVTLSVTGYDAAFLAQALTANTDDHLTLLVDNSAGVSTGHINSLKAFTSSHVEVVSTGAGACPAYEIGPGGYVVLNVTVRDDNKHIAYYLISPEFGHASIGVTAPGERAYQPPSADPFPGIPYQAPATAAKSFGGGTEDIIFYPTVNCCYDFRLYAAKRVTNGSGSPGEYTADFQTATIKVS